jgi:penicillin-binding protein 1C
MSAINWRWRLKWWQGLIATLLLPLLLLLAVIFYIEQDCSEGALTLPPCLIITDASGEVLYFSPDSRGERHRARHLKDIPRQLQEAFLAAEDNRFHDHIGIDLRAVLRATWDNLKARKIVSGASTITMQLVRCNSMGGRSLGAKIREAVKAIVVERHLSKDHILELYLNSVPMGRNIRGVDLASERYFGLPLGDLSLAQCATLAALPKAPGTLDPVSGDLERLRKRRHWILDRMVKCGFIDVDIAMAAQSEFVIASRPTYLFRAPHFCHRILNEHDKYPHGKCSDANIILKTSLDADLQDNVKAILVSHRERLRDLGASQAAAMVVRNRDHAVIAYIGSLGWENRASGFNDGVRAARSSGSTLKPFLYALALERGYDPAAFFEDLEQYYATPGGEYRPRNASGDQYGPIGMRVGLGSSLNLTAIKLVQSLGCESSLSFLSSCQLPVLPVESAENYGLGLAIGNLEVSLESLVTAYAMLADGGMLRPLCFTDEQVLKTTRRVLSTEASWIITNMLSDPIARSLGFSQTPLANFPGPVAIKTGTSTYNRDAWILAYTREYTLGIWAGNFDGLPSVRLGGMDAGEPILEDILTLIYGDSSPGEFHQPAGVELRTVCTYSGHSPTEYCTSLRQEWYFKGNGPGVSCSFHQNQGAQHELPAAFASWIEEHNISGDSAAWRLARNDRAAETAYSIGEGVGLQITYPLANDHFRLDSSSAPYRIPLKVRLDRPLPWVCWFVDGIELARVGAPYEMEWTLCRGKHRISASGPDMLGTEVTLFVD